MDSTNTQAWWLHPLRDILAGTVGGIGGKLIEFPFDTVKVRLQAALSHNEPTGTFLPSSIPSTTTVAKSSSSSASSSVVLTNSQPWNVFRTIIEKEGFTAFYRGLSLPLAGTVLETATLFTANGYLKRYLSQLGHMKATDDLPMNYVLLAGAGTGFCVSWVLTPIELVKCRLQVQLTPLSDKHTATSSSSSSTSSSSPSTSTVLSKNSPKPYRGPIDCLVRSINEEGLRVLYRGHIGTILREVPGTACWFAAYETFVRAMTPVGKTRDDLPAWVIVTAGALGGMSYWSIMYPADTVKSVMQTMTLSSLPSSSSTNNTQSTSSPSLSSSSLTHVHRREPSFFGTFLSLYRSVGVKGLYAGMLPTFLRAAPSNAVIFLGYEWASRLLGNLWNISDNYDNIPIVPVVPTTGGSNTHHMEHNVPARVQ